MATTTERPYSNNGLLIGTGAAAPARSIAALTTGEVPVGITGYPPVPVRVAFPVTAWGAVGDGVTDDTTAINAAISAASAAGGGVVTFPPGTYMASQLVLKSDVVLDGGTPGAVTLKQISGSNRDFIISENFATFTGTSSVANHIPRWFGLRDIAIDGNKAGNSTGRGIAWYGNAFFMQGTVWVGNCASDNIWTECGTAFFQNNPFILEDALEPYFDTVISWLPGGDGWRYKGPSDGVIRSYLCLLDAGSGWGFYSETSIDSIGLIHCYNGSNGHTSRNGIHIGGGTHVINTLMTDGEKIEITAGALIDTIFMTFMGIGGAAGPWLTVSASNVVITNIAGGFDPAPPNNLVGILWSGNHGRAQTIGLYAGAITSATGIIGLKDTGGLNHLRGLYLQQFTGTGHIALDAQSSGGAVYTGEIESAKTGLAYNPGGGFNEIRLVIQTSAGQVAVSGATPSADDRVDILATGAVVGKTDVQVLSANSISLTTTALQVITVAHGCLYAPSAREIHLSVSVTGGVTDWAWDLIPMVGAADATNVGIYAKLRTASATGGATASIAMHIRMGA